MWVRAKEKIQISAAEAEIMITQSVQKGSKWLAFFEEQVNENLPWRLNHKHLNIRMKEERFRELFEEVKREEDHYYG